MAQRKMFDEELSELGEQHEKQTEKLKRVTAEEKQKLEVQLEQAVVGQRFDKTLKAFTPLHWNHCSHISFVGIKISKFC